MMSCRVTHPVFAAVVAVVGSGHVAVGQLDSSWAVTVNGQTVQVRSDGTFFVPNISAADQFGGGGPGTAPDFLSDDFLRILGSSTVNGETRWVFNDPFQIRQGETFLVGDLTITDTPPPMPISIAVVPSVPTLNAIDATSQLNVTGTMPDGTTADLTPRSTWTIYRTSNPNTVSINGDGLVAALGPGPAFITATNFGATSVTRVVVVPGDPLTTLEGFVQFEDGCPVEGAEVSLLVLVGSDITDADGFFSISGLPSEAAQPFTVRAAISVGEQSFIGTVADLEPFPDGITDAGIITLVTTGGGLGPIILSGMDPEDHGGPGQDMIRDLMNFVVTESALHTPPTRIAMLGGSTGRANNASNIAASLGLTLSHFTGQGILDVELSPSRTQFDAIYMPTSTSDISGGISSSDMARINQRGPDVVRFVNAGGGLASFAQNVSGGYGWLPLGGLDIVNLGSGGSTGIALTLEGVFLLSPSATAVQPFHTAFVGPPGFFGLDVLATESFGAMRPLIIGGLGSIPPDCNLNGIEDVLDLANGTSQDCNDNGIPDECDDDCNANGIADECDITAGTSVDVIGPGAMPDGVPDECQLDCNGNSVPDMFDIDSGFSPDCNGNVVPDDCDLASGTSNDCNTNSVPDSCDVASGTSPDCNVNGLPDECDVTGGTSADCNGNAVPDECDLDCNGNTIPDDCDISSGSSSDCNSNAVPDECDLATGTSADCNGNLGPDECDISAGTSSDAIGVGAVADGIPDECQVDCDGNLVPDGLDLSSGTSPDCNGNSVPDECDLSDGFSEDCNGNGTPDECDVVATIVYDVALADLVDVPNNCGGGSLYATGSQQPGFTWVDRGSGPAMGVNIEFNVGVECHATGTTLGTFLNGVSDATYASTSRFCSCSFTPGALASIDADPAAYNVGGSNVFIIDNATSWGFIPRSAWGSGVYARVTVEYDPSLDCNFNMIPDECDLANGTSADSNGDGLPDECGQDCNGNGFSDTRDIAVGTSRDCNGNFVPDECDIAGGTSPDVIGTGGLPDGIPDDCQADCNSNLAPDDLDIADGASQDCNGNAVPDDCDLADGTSVDANGNGLPDECQTDVVGFVVDGDGVAVGGAALGTNGGVTGTTLGDGSFSIINVPATDGDIIVLASADAGGVIQFGSSMAIVPAPAGVTDVGTIVLAACGFENDIGSALNQGDDATTFVVFTGGFTFPYFGSVQSGVFINSNGNLTFGAGNTTFNPSIPIGVVNGLPRISPAFVDLNPSAGGGVFVNQFADRFVATWSNVPLFGSAGGNTFQVVLHGNGRIDFVYNGMTADGTQIGFGTDLLDISVAVSPGGTPSLQAVDFSTDSPLSSSNPTQAVLENFDFGNTFDLDFHCVVWDPNAGDGFDVTIFQFAPCVPAGLVSGVVLDGSGNPVPSCPVVVASSGDPSFLVVTQTGPDGSFQVTGVPVPGGISVRTLQIDADDPTGTASGILWEEGELLEVVVTPHESVGKE